MVSFEIFVKAMPPSLSELKVLPSFCFAFKILDDRAVTNKYWRRPQKQTSTLNNLLLMKKCTYQENVFFSNKTIQDTALWHIMIWSTSQSQTDQEIWELYGDEDRPSRIAIKNYDGIRLQVTVSPAKNKIPENKEIKSLKSITNRLSNFSCRFLNLIFFPIYILIVSMY